MVKFLDDELLESIVAEAREVLVRLGVEIHNPTALGLLGDHGAEIDATRQRARIPEELVDRALEAARECFALYDVLGNQTHDLSGDNVHFTPGSAAIHVLDHATGRMRRPTTADYIRHVKLVNRLPNIAAQSTAFIPADVPEAIQDSYRLFLSLLYGEKPVVTGAFTIESFNVMRDLQLAVRGSAHTCAPVRSRSSPSARPRRSSGAASPRRTCSTAPRPESRSSTSRCRWPGSWPR